MGTADLTVDILLGLGVAGELLCVVGVLVMRTTFDRLHYSSAATTVPALLILAAVLVREHVTAGGLEAIAAVGFMFLLNPAVVLATAMAIRRAEEGEET